MTGSTPLRVAGVDADPFGAALASLEAETMTWEEYEFLAQAIDLRFEGSLQQDRFRFTLPKRLQGGPVRLRRDYEIPVAYTVWGAPSDDVVICLGGIANSARRFDFMAMKLSARHRVLCPDWIGRGRSGWAAHTSHYRHEVLVQQVLALIDHVRARRVRIVGSSLGGAVALSVAVRRPKVVAGLAFNDFGPFLPVGRRRRRAEALDRHYVFRNPRDVFRRGGASQKNDGPIGDDVLLHNTYHQTRWSEEDAGRVYRHDPRAMYAYALDAKHSVELWHEWDALRCPVLTLHGELSDALLPETIDRMLQRDAVQVADVPDTGHTPALSDPAQIETIARWLDDPADLPRRWRLLYAEPDSTRKLFT